MPGRRRPDPPAPAAAGGLLVGGDDVPLGVPSSASSRATSLVEPVDSQVDVGLAEDGHISAYIRVSATRSPGSMSSRRAASPRLTARASEPVEST